MKKALLPNERDKFFFEEALATLEFQRNKKGNIISAVFNGTGLPVSWTLTDESVSD